MTLEIAHNVTGQVHRYSDVEEVSGLGVDLGEDDVESTRSASDGRVEVSDCTVEVHSAELLGAPWLPAVPAGRHRARLLDDDGAVVYDGTVTRAGLRCDDPADGDDPWRVWTVRLLAAAQDDLRDRLDGVTENGVRDALRAAGYVYEIPTLCAFTVGDGTTPGETRYETREWLDLVGMLTVGLAHVGANLESIDPLFDLTTYYQADGETRAYRRTDTRLAVARAGGGLGWTLGEAYDLVRQMAGLTTEAVYAPFPSAEVRVRLIDGRWREPEALPPAVDVPALPAAAPVDPLALGGYSVGCDPAEVECFRIAYEPEPYAGYGADATEDAAPGSESAGVCADDSGEQLPVRLARVVEPADSFPFVDGAYSETVVYERPAVDADGAEDAVYVAAVVFVDEGQGPVPRALKRREVDSPPPGIVSRYAHEAWALTLWTNHVPRAYETFTLELELDEADLAEAGAQWPTPDGLPGLLDPALGVTVGGLAWACTEVDRNADTGQVAVSAYRPGAARLPVPGAGNPSSPGDETPTPTLNPPSADARIIDRTGERDGVPYTQYFAVVDYGPGPGSPAPTSYEAQRLGPGNTWEPITGDGEIQVNDETDHRYYRVRAHYDQYSTTTAWTYAGTDGSSQPPAGAPS